MLRVCRKREKEFSAVFESSGLPLKSAKKRQREFSLEKAREEKRNRFAGESSTEIAESGVASREGQVSDMAALIDVSIDELDADN